MKEIYREIDLINLLCPSAHVNDAIRQGTELREEGSQLE